MNKVILSGRLTKDLELRYTPNGVATATFTIASNRRFKRDGQPEADFINCVIWQKAAESAANHVGKGCRVSVVGRWETRSYEGQDGKRVYVNECVVEEIDFIDFANDLKGQQQGQGERNTQSNTNTGGGNQNTGNGQQERQNNYTRVDDDPFANDKKTIDISDDDLPF